MRPLLLLLPIVGALVGALATIVIAGMFMPRRHNVSASIVLPKPPEEVWRVITSVEDFPSWRKEVRSVERLSGRDGRPAYREFGSMGPMTLEETLLAPPRKRVTTIADDSLPFGGSWTFELTAEGAGTRLTITEDGFVKPAGFRYIGRIVGYDATIKNFLRQLAARFGATPTIDG